MFTTARLAFLGLTLALSACAVRPDDGSGNTDPVDAAPPSDSAAACDEDNDCTAAPACHTASCVRGECEYASNCESGETCNPQGVCETPPPPPPAGNGKIVCSDPPGSSETTIVISNGILAHLIGGDGIMPNENWRVGFGTGSVGTETRAWVSDAATYTVAVTNTAALFNFSLRPPTGGQEYWFDLNEFDVSGTCSHAPNATAISHTVPGTTNPGNGTITCRNVLNGQNVDVTISSVAAHLKLGNGEDADGTVFPNASYLLRWGGDPAGRLIDVNPFPRTEVGWVDGNIVLRLPGNTTSFNMALYNPATHAVWWLDLNEFDVTNLDGATCTHPMDAGSITRMASSQQTPTMVGEIRCRLTMDNGVLKREVTIAPNPNAGGIIAGTVTEGSPVTSPESIKLDATQQTLTWAGNYSTHNFLVAEGVDDFNFVVVDNNDGADTVPGGDYLRLDAWTIINLSSQYGTSTCQRVGGGVSIDAFPN